jgi:DNA-binding SARP family transcriptional activator
VIRLRTLGTLDLRDAEGRALDAVLAQPKRIALLAYLALATPRGSHRRDTILAILWPEQDAEHGRNALAQAIYFLRRALGPGALVGRGDALGLDRRQVWCDAVAFEETLDAGRVDEALALYQGELLQGLHVGGAHALDEWLDGERARLGARYGRALEAQAAEREAARDFAGVVGAWTRLAAHDPLSSRVALGLIRALAAAGDPGAAVQHAQHHEALLSRELAVAPDPEIVAFVKRLRDVHPERVRVARGSRPAAPAPLPAPPVDASAAAVLRHAPAADSIVRVARSRRRQRALGAGLAALVLAGGTVAASLAMRAPAADSRPERFLTDLYRKGRQAELSRNYAGLLSAKALYERAVRQDSTFALGYAGLAGVYGLLGDYAYAPIGPALDSARLMARRAVARDSTLSEAHAALAVTLGDAGQFEVAEREFQHAMRLDPRNPHARYWYSMLLVALGRGHDALREANVAAALDSFPPRALLGMQRSATYLITGQRPHLKLPVAKRRTTLQREPGEPWAHARDAMDFAEEGQCVEAHKSLSRARELVPADNIRMLQFVGHVYWYCGERARARALVREMKRRPDAPEQGLRMAWLHAQFGEADSAFVWLARHRWTMAELSALSADRALDPLRSDPRYLELQRTIGVRK